MTAKTKILQLSEKNPVQLKERAGWNQGFYKLSTTHIGAIQAAFFANRPLLVRGGPGLGKSQLAHAIASIVDWGLMSCVVHYNTTIDDLLYSIDHIARLDSANNNTEKVGELSQYVKPGKLWQTIAPDTLAKYDKDKPHNLAGTVLLIDEIDKADSTLPNALLEVLAAGVINVPCIDQPIQTKASHPYFIVVTSNEERLLPKAFLRRCAVLELQIPEEKSEAIAWLMDIYTTHYPAAQSESDLNEAQAVAEKVITQRNTQNDDDYFAGTSEFLDMIKALREYPENERNSERLALLSKHLVEKTQLRG